MTRGNAARQPSESVTSNRHPCSAIGSSVASDNHYDQIALFPAEAKSWLLDLGVFDYDAVVFRDLWTAKGQASSTGISGTTSRITGRCGSG
jgi:hypothetical protein